MTFQLNGMIMHGCIPLTGDRITIPNNIAVITFNCPENIQATPLWVYDLLAYRCTTFIDVYRHLLNFPYLLWEMCMYLPGSGMNEMNLTSGDPRLRLNWFTLTERVSTNIPKDVNRLHGRLRNIIMYYNKSQLDADRPQQYLIFEDFKPDLQKYNIQENSVNQTSLSNFMTQLDPNQNHLILLHACRGINEPRFFIQGIPILHRMWEEFIRNQYIRYNQSVIYIPNAGIIIELYPYRFLLFLGDYSTINLDNIAHMIEEEKQYVYDRLVQMEEQSLQSINNLNKNWFFQIFTYYLLGRIDSVIDSQTADPLQSYSTYMSRATVECHKDFQVAMRQVLTSYNIPIKNLFYLYYENRVIYDVNYIYMRCIQGGNRTRETLYPEQEGIGYDIRAEEVKQLSSDSYIPQLIAIREIDIYTKKKRSREIKMKDIPKATERRVRRRIYSTSPTRQRRSQSLRRIRQRSRSRRR